MQALKVFPHSLIVTFPILEDRRENSVLIRAIRLCNAQSKVLEQDKQSRSYSIKDDKYRLIKSNWTGS